MNYTSRILSILTVLFLIPAATGAPEIDEGRADVLPWSGYWWPHRQGALHAEGGPLPKYDTLTGRSAAKWEREQYPPGEEVPAWHGYCHAWAASSVLETEPRQGTTLPAHSGSRSTSLSVGDQKGLLAVSHSRDTANVYGERYNEGDTPDTKADLAPDALWRLLKLYVGKQKLPLILDVDAGPQVWNYPVYAYKVESEPAGIEGQHHARMTIWMADDAVPPGYVGVKVRRHSYAFTYQKRGSSVVMGSAKWTGPSVEDHPDFAWYPLKAVPENPEIDYSTVKKLLTAAPDPSPEPARERYDPDHPRAEPGSPSRQDRSIVLSPLELVALIANRTSSFKLDATVDRFDGGMYTAGEPFTVRGVSEKAGYLYLFHIDPVGHLEVLYPPPSGEQRVTAGEEFSLPGLKEKAGFLAQLPPGVHRLKVVVTSRPLTLSGMMPRQNQGVAGQFRWSPTQAKAVQQLLQRHLQGTLKPGEMAWVDPKPILGDFAQDEIAFVVRVAENKPVPQGKP